MFLHDLSEEQQRAFLVIAQEFMRVDGVKPEEEALLETFKRETGLRKEEISDELSSSDVDDWASVFDERKSRVSMLMELIGLGHIDSDFSDAEHDFIERFADHFGFDDTELDVLENWVLRQIALTEEAEALRNGTV